MPVLAPLALLAMTTYGFDSARLALVPRRLGEFVSQGSVAGTVVLVQRHGKTVLFDAQGLADRENRVPMRRDTIFQIMSMTKPITAIAVVQCAEAGLLSLDDRIERYLPGFRDVQVRQADGTLRAPKSKPTIRQLLTHTAGFGSIDPGGLDDDAKRKLSLGAYMDLMPKEPLVGDPGEAVRYSGPGFATLGRIVEVVSGQPLERYMEERIFRPLGLKDTFFFSPQDRYGRIARMYDGDKLVEPDPYRRGARLANPAGGLYSTADDMAKLLTAVCEGGKPILSRAGVEVMTRVQTGPLLVDGSEAQGFGLGFAVVKSAVGQMTLKPVGTFGHTGAFGTEFWADRTRGVVAVYMAQTWDDAPRKAFNTMVNAAFVGP